MKGYPNVLAWGIWNWGRAIFFLLLLPRVYRKNLVRDPDRFSKISYVFIYIFSFFFEYNTHRKSNRLEKRNMKLEGWKEKCKSTACSATAPPPSSVNSVAALILPTYFWKIEKQNKNNKNSKARKKDDDDDERKEEEKKRVLREGEKYKKENTKMKRRRCLKNVEKTKVLRIRGKGGGGEPFLIFSLFLKNRKQALLLWKF